MSRHGGKRRGAGRRPTHGYWDKFRIALACEQLWQEAAKKALDDAIEHEHGEASELEEVWTQAHQVPVAERRQWLAGDGFEQHRSDVETELHALAGTDPEAGPPPRMFRFEARPPRGTRKRIISEVASAFDAKKSTVDNIWQWYRRELKAMNLRNPPQS